MQKSMDLSSQACNDFRHTISTKKREVMHQPAPEAPYTEPHITVTGQRLAVTGKFVYLTYEDTEVYQRAEMESIHTILMRF